MLKHRLKGSSESARKLAAAMEERGDKVPDSIANEPELDEGLVFFYQAFWALRRRGEGPIEWLEIVTYCDHYGYDDEDEFHTLMVRMDDVWLEDLAARRKAEQERGAKNGR